jgi:trehalose synthase
MVTVQPVADELTELAGFQDVIGPLRTERMRDAAAGIGERLGGGTLWHVNSTAAGGGVAEMMHTLLPLYRSLSVRTGWLVVGGDERFFATTKRLGVALYGTDDGSGPLSRDDREHYLRAQAASAEQLARIVGPEDVVVLHDHQTAGLAPLLTGRVARIYWRCHVGVDEPTPAADAAWAFLAPLLDDVDGLLFSVRRHVRARLRDHRPVVLPPFISPFSPKNRELDGPVIQACLAHCGLRAGAGPAGRIPLRHPVRVLAERTPRPGEPLLTQVSRWDRLKDMHGVLAAFAQSDTDGFLALVGPDPGAIADDVEQQAWFDECVRTLDALPSRRRERVALVCLPMADLDENALLVNAIQRASDVVLQKSLAEGFGLTVAEAMWKSRVVLASAVGGIREQITHGHDGLLAADPLDRSAFAGLLESAVDSRVPAGRMGARAHEKVRRDFLTDREVVTTAALLGDGQEKDDEKKGWNDDAYRNGAAVGG